MYVSKENKKLKKKIKLEENKAKDRLWLDMVFYNFKETKQKCVTIIERKVWYDCKGYTSLQETTDNDINNKYISLYSDRYLWKVIFIRRNQTHNTKVKKRKRMKKTNKQHKHKYTKLNLENKD